MDKKQTDLNRRRFLLAAGAGGVGIAVVVAKGGGSAPPPPKEAGAEARSGGYSETGHVRNYYRTTRV